MSYLLSPEDIADLLVPYTGSAKLPADLHQKLAVYLELILKWNARVNLTAIRDPLNIVQRHFGESLFAGLHLDPTCDSLLDLGSGAGFPGVPVQLLHSHLSVTLAESRTRKAAFLQEVIRTLDLNAEVWAGRAESMPLDRSFHTVTLRAVDEMNAAVGEASRRARKQVIILGTHSATYPTLGDRFQFKDPIPMPNSDDGVIWIAEPG